VNKGGGGQIQPYPKSKTGEQQRGHPLTPLKFTKKKPLTAEHGRGALCVQLDGEGESRKDYRAQRVESKDSPQVYYMTTQGEANHGEATDSKLNSK